MASEPQTSLVSRRALVTGWILSVLPALLLLFSASAKLMKPAAVVEGFNHLGLDVGLALGLGILELACVIIYLIPRTAVLGAILLTGYLGGAILTHLRIGEPFYGPVILGVVIWGGLYFRDSRLRALIPLRS